MNHGNIPGFYFDEEKKKYFRITADNAAPRGAKYALSNVRKEKQASKRRKLDQRIEQRRSTETIKRSSILKRPEISGIGLQRELGYRSNPQHHNVQAEAAFVSQLTRTTSQFWGGRPQASVRSLLQIHPLSLPNQVITAFTFGGVNDITFVNSSKLATAIPDSDVGLTKGRDSTRYSIEIQAESNLTCFHSRLQDLSIYTPADSSLPSYIVACAASRAQGRVNIQIASLMSQEHSYSHSHSYNLAFPQSAINLSLGDEETTFWACCISPLGDRVGLASSDSLWNLDITTGQIAGRISDIEESRSLSHLTQTLLAAGSGDKVLLWDTRSSGASTRFHAKNHRNGSRITGVRGVPKSDGNQLLASTNRSLQLFDVRMPSSKDRSRSIFTYPILHETPQFYFDVHPTLNLIAGAVKEGVGVWSLLTGKRVRMLEVPVEQGSNSLPLPTQVAWRESDVRKGGGGAPYVQATLTHELVSWSWEDI